MATKKKEEQMVRRAVTVIAGETQDWELSHEFTPLCSPRGHKFTFTCLWWPSTPIKFKSAGETDHREATHKDTHTQTHAPCILSVNPTCCKQLLTNVGTLPSNPSSRIPLKKLAQTACKDTCGQTLLWLALLSPKKVLRKARQSTCSKYRFFAYF